MPPATEAEALATALAAELSAGCGATTPRCWFYTQDGERFGPVTAADLRAAALLGFLGPQDHVRCGHEGTWVRAHEIAGLF